MFEKEAEDSFKCKKVLYKWETDKHSYIDGFKDGAKFVYNKACEDYKNPQLTKAKEIIKDYMTIAKGIHSTVCGVPEENRTIHVLKLNEEAEQFLNSEVEK
jgi:hypothetical protein